ncbi:EAL domain-containing protein [uncultured Dysosmobacter sp.]|uniref:EAL domain-containing protein n=1 Tax=uncultured Dysosmobacter sp. TaxID=2591384 RepID=UPI0026355EDF|nr:EAL domain-containing protein [uncultured Dysosmobacter sp.]
MSIFYSVIVLEVILLMIYLMIMANANDLLPRNKRRMFLVLFFSIIVSISAEWLGSAFTLHDRQFRWLHFGTKILELSLTPFVPLMCAEILNQPSSDKSWISKWSYAVLAVHTGLEVLSAFTTGFIVYVSEDDVFCHGPFYWIYLLTYLGAAIYVLHSGYRVCRKYQNRNKIMLPLMLALLLFGVAVNQYDKSVKVAWLTVATVVTLFYIFYCGMMQRMDETTSLLNRASYNGKLTRLHESAVIQLFDIDFFKSVNDKYGHIYGDSCLQTIGGIIRNIYGRYGKCYRTGGDEFCVILDSAECPIEQLNKDFVAEMEKCREGDRRFPYISFGYAKWKAASETVDEAVERADSIMYRDKDRNKIKYGPVYHPESEKKDMPSMQASDADSAELPSKLDTSGLTTRAFSAFSATSESSYIFLCNMHTGVSRWSPAAVRYFNLPGEYMFNAQQIWETYIHPQDRKAYHESIEAVFSGKAMFHDLEYRVKNYLGEYVVCTCRGVVLKGDENTPDLFAGTIINHGVEVDVDPVTNLHTDAKFSKSIYSLLQESTCACLLSIGIENFHHINMMYGQEGGNKVLRLFGMELLELVEGNGQVFRMEGAKFILYLHHTGEDEARSIFRHVQTIAEKNIKISNIQIPLRLCGGAVLLDGCHSYSEYIVRSSLTYAMEQSLKAYRGELVFHEAIGQIINVENMQIHREIHRSAVENCENFYLCYQPIISFATGKVTGAEALLRWKKEPYGVVSPDRFIFWLENDPSFIKVGSWILRQAIEETRPLWQADPNFKLNVNVADTQLNYRGFRDDIINILEETGCPPQNLCLELTERCHRLDISYLAGELEFFHSLGIDIAIDDYGTGSSSLILPLQLPVDEIKIDRLFVSKIFTDKNYLHMMEGVLITAKKSGTCTCVEGIETKAQYDLIASLGGDCYQGYYASRPVEISNFLKFCCENTKKQKNGYKFA